MRVLVTGAAGFIGQHVSSALAKAGHEVIGLDVRFVDGWGASDFIEADIRQPLRPIPGLDAVIHLAAIAAPRECDKDPGRAFDVNVNGTLQVLRMMLESGAKKVVFSSSAHVYDIPSLYLPADESHPLRLNNTYTTTKLLGEHLCDLHWTNYGLSYTVLRLFNAYGPGQRTGYFIPDKLAQAKSGHVTLSGGGTTKDWVSIEDVVRAFVLALNTSFVGAVNIGTGKETSLFDIAAYLAERCGATYTFVDSQRDVTHMCANIGRAKRILGWEPKTDIWEGLHAVLGEAKSPALR